MGSRKSVGRYGLGVFGIALFISGLFFCPASAVADGMFAKGRLEKKIPSIPWQRALLTYKDGVEKLTIQSAVEAEGAKLGWIVPVPSIPTEIGKGSVGAIQVLSMHMQPRIVDGAFRSSDETVFRFTWLASVCAAFGTIALTGRPRAEKIATLVPIAAIVAALPWFFGPNHLSAYRSEAKTGGMMDSPVRSSVTVEATARIGSYDVVTLKAEKADELRAWLVDNGFSELTGDSAAIAQRYIEEGWHFVAAKLIRDGTGIAVPHPLAITFPTKRAVYPMRLTALSGAELYLELYIVAEQGALIDRLAVECREDVKRIETPRSEPTFMIGEPYSELPGGRKSPALQALLWKDAWVTKLTGRLQPRDMNEDYYPSFAPASHYHRTLYTQAEAQRLAWVWGCGAWSVAVVLGVFGFYQLLRAKRIGQGRALLLGGVIASVSAAVCGAVEYRGIPITEVVRDTSRRQFDSRHFSDWGLVNTIAKANKDFAGASPEQIAAVFSDYFTYTASYNPFTHTRVAFDDAPGDVTIEKEDGAVVVRLYDIAGAPVGLRLTPGETQDITTHRPIPRTPEPQVLWNGLPDKIDYQDPRVLEDALRNRGMYMSGANGAFTGAMYTCLREQERFFPLLRDGLRRLVEHGSGNVEILEFYASALGLMTRIVPPSDVMDRAATQKFLEAVSRYQPPKGTVPSS